ncbi:MAG: caspase family protein [bacterium]
MKTKILLLLLLCISVTANAQEVSEVSKSGKISIYNTEKILQEVQEYVNDSVSEWQKKGLLEKTAEYKKRVTEASRQKLIDTLTQKKINEIANQIIDLNIKDIEYDADNEVYKVDFYALNPVYFNVPIKNNQAKLFNDNKKELTFKNAKYTITSDDKFAVLEVDVFNPSNDETYEYNSSKNITFKQQEVTTSFGAVEVDISSEPTRKPSETGKEIKVGKSDVDIKIPETEVQRENTYALIIGNENYKKYQSRLTSEQNVEFAKNDAKTFAQYCRLTLGVPKENIRLETNVISSKMRRDIEWLVSKAKYGGEDVKLIFYFSGHGAPHEETKEKYLMPVDISGSHVDEGIKLSKLYKELTQYSSERVTTFIDACFSGGGRETGLLAAKVVKVEPKDNTIFEGNLISFSSSQGEQRSYFYKEKQHGLFTYYLLKKIKQSKGNIQYGDLKNYLTKKVPLKSVDLYEDKQVPAINYSLDVKEKWENWKLIDRE